MERARDIEAARPSAAELGLGTDVLLLRVLDWTWFTQRENHDLRLVGGVVLELQ
jgi:hypothetical protein